MCMPIGSHCVSLSFRAYLKLVFTTRNAADVSDLSTHVCVVRSALQELTTEDEKYSDDQQFQLLLSPCFILAELVYASL